MDLLHASYMLGGKQSNIKRFLNMTVKIFIIIIIFTLQWWGGVGLLPVGKDSRQTWVFVANISEATI